MSKRRPSKRHVPKGHSGQTERPTGDGAQVEGRQAVRELLISGQRQVKQLLIAQDQDSSEVLSDIRELAQMNRVLVTDVSKKRLMAEAVTAAPQGVVARAEPITFVDLEDLVASENPMILVLDGVTDPQNFGAICRIAECAGVKGIVISERRSVRITPTVAKAAAGALEHVSIARVAGIPSAISALTDAGVLTVGLDAAGEIDIFDPSFPVEPPVALVLGREGAGLSKLVRQRVDKLLAIPLIGSLNSLNVASATAVATFEVVRRMQSVERNSTS